MTDTGGVDRETRERLKTAGWREDARKVASRNWNGHPNPAPLETITAFRLIEALDALEHSEAREAEARAEVERLRERVVAVQDGWDWDRERAADLRAAWEAAESAHIKTEDRLLAEIADLRAVTTAIPPEDSP
jgi:hypothetical protein